MSPLQSSQVWLQYGRSVLGLTWAQSQGVLEVEAQAEEEEDALVAPDAAEQAQTLSRPQTAATESEAQEGAPDGEQQDDSTAGKAKGKGKGKGKKGKAAPDPDALANAAEQRLKTASLLFQERFQREQVGPVCYDTEHACHVLPQLTAVSVHRLWL